ncbi:MAG: octaprenyl-diphosphate synthase [Deltaproteobacteria bacterium]|nr:MAG: octaprenyl-diphosphate synthase [Deltaproteobacteria bacterium]
MSDALLTARAVDVSPLADAQRLVAPALQLVERQIEQSTSSAVQLVPEVARHLVDSGGKRIRPTLSLLVCRLAGGHAEDDVELAAATELFHNASLLHDDVVDRGHVRRGVPAAPRVYGNSASVLVGDFLMARALKLVVEHGSRHLLEHLCSTITSMAEGEVLQLVRSGRMTLNMPGYEQIISGKTAGLFSWCCRAGACQAGAKESQVEAAARLGKFFGMAFQVTDDVLDYTSGPERSGKDLANDLQQGKVTLPLLFACERDSSLFECVEELARGEPGPEQCLHIVERVIASDAIDRSMEMARDFCGKVSEELGSFAGGPESEVIERLTAHLLERVS